jgi:hypothetical protein
MDDDSKASIHAYNPQIKIDLSVLYIRPEGVLHKNWECSTAFCLKLGDSIKLVGCCKLREPSSAQRLHLNAYTMLKEHKILIHVISNVHGRRTLLSSKIREHHRVDLDPQ